MFCVTFGKRPVPKSNSTYFLHFVFKIWKIITSTSTYEGGPTMDSHTIIHSGKESVKIEEFLKIYFIEQR